MRKHNQIHTLDVLHHKANFRVLKKLTDLSVPYGLKNTVMLLFHNVILMLFMLDQFSI